MAGTGVSPWGRRMDPHGQTHHAAAKRASDEELDRVRRLLDAFEEDKR